MIISSKDFLTRKDEIIAALMVENEAKESFEEPLIHFWYDDIPVSFYVAITGNLFALPFFLEKSKTLYSYITGQKNENILFYAGRSSTLATVDYIAQYKEKFSKKFFNIINSDGEKWWYDLIFNNIDKIETILYLQKKYNLFGPFEREEQDFLLAKRGLIPEKYFEAFKNFVANNPFEIENI